MNRTYTVGYYKDLIAVITFIFALPVVASKDGGVPKHIVIIALLACIVIDGAFTLNPSWHCMRVGKNMASYAVILQMIFAFSILSFIFVKQLKQ